MELLLCILICFSRCKLQPKITLDGIEVSTNDTTVSYAGNGTITLALGQLAIGKPIIEIKEGITAIEDFAFSKISTPSTIPGVESIFSYQKVYLPRSLQSIGKYAFSCVNSNMSTCLLPLYTGPNTEADKENFYALRTIGEGAFMNCNKLTKANIPNTVTEIENYVFKGVPVTGYTLNSKVKSIGIGAFQDCGLTHFTIPEGVTSIGALAFGNCTSLASVVCNAKSCSFGSECFKNCASLDEFTFPQTASLEIPGGFFENCASLTTCTMPTTLANADALENTMNMFSNCQKLSQVTLPTNIQSLGAGMFKNTSIETLYLPTTVNTIGAESLKDCTKLKYVNISSTNPVNLSLNIFDNTPNLELLSIHGDLGFPTMDEDMFGGKKLCYYGTTNPVVAKNALDPSVTTIYVTKEFKEKYSTFGDPLNLPVDPVTGFPYEVMQGSVCAFPGEPGLPNETETMSFSEEMSESEISSGEESSQSLDYSDLPTTEAPSESGVINNGENKKKKKKLSTGAIIGIVLGCLAFLALLLLLIICCCKKRKNNDLKTKDDRKESSIGLKKTPSKKDYESVDNLKENQPEKLMV